MKLQVLAAILVSSSAVGQARTPVVAQVPERPSCPRCQIQVRRLPLDAAAAGLNGLPTSVQVDQRGRFWVFSPQLPPLVFDSTGRFLRRIGAVGSGPGEFLPGGTMATLSGDSILVLDVRNGRAVVVTPDLTVLRSVPLTMSIGRIIGFGDGSFVVSGAMRAPDHAGMPLHLVRLTQTQLALSKSFGSPTGNISTDPGGSVALRWEVALAEDGGVWTEELLAYRVRKWSKSGELITSIERQASWFEPQSTQSLGSPNVAPAPVARGVSAGQGLLWTFTHVPDADWKRAWPPESTRQRELPASAMDFSALFDLVVEAIDPGVYRVVSRVRLSDYAISTLPGGRVAVYREDANGVPMIEVLSLSIKRA